MCGIAGTINIKKDIDNIIKSQLYHRGPDEFGSFKYKSVQLFHSRLSIQDISNGNQPFEYKDYVIVYNGEIYNHHELRANYLQEFQFRTNSDTETLLYLYIKYNSQMLNLLDGMFAFAILNKNTRELFFARDRSGKKPLYFFKENNKFFFASELNTIKACINLEINNEYIESYLRAGFFYNKLTPYNNVEEVEAGCYYTVNINTLKLMSKRYFNILEYYSNPLDYDFNNTISELDLLLHKSVKDRLDSSDLEVGAFLSGGIDSSLIVAIASEYKKNLKTFTVKFDGAFDESHLAKLTAEKYNTNHHEINISMNLKNDIEKILLNYGEPFMDSSAIPSYYVSKEAKKHVTVILNGDGADELFGGYRRYVPIANNWLKIASKFSFLLKILSKPNSKKSFYNYGYRLLSMSNKSGLDFYLSATNDIFEDEYKFPQNIELEKLDKYINSIENENISELSKMLSLDFNLILFSDLLIKMDIATMSNSLEGRSPFLSKYMLEFAPRITDNLKINGKVTKYILRELSKKYLTQELFYQPKRGFEVPLKNWIDNDLKENIYDTLNRNTYVSNFIEKKFISELLNNSFNVSKEKRAKMLWTMYCLEVWNKNNG